MIEALGITAGAFGLGWVAYQYGKLRSKTDGGCNGHHWGDPYRPDDPGVSRPERERAGLPKSVVNNPSKHLTTEVLEDTVVLRGKAIKKCQDCGERTVEDITVGTVPVSAFENPDEDVIEGTNAVDVTHSCGTVEELQARLKAVEGVSSAEVYARQMDDYQ
jgi:hypothetical protein